MNFKKNKRVWINIIILVLIFFSFTLWLTWETAAPYCRADDWRFIDIYLRPLFNGKFHLQDLWSDGVHPMPVYAGLFVICAKYFDLQMIYIARFAVFFQLLLGLIVSYLFVKSLKNNVNNNLTLYLSLISINTIIFSFIVQTPYTWPIMTTLFLSSFLLILIGYLIDLYYNSFKAPNKIILIKMSALVILTLILYSDWILIFSVSLFFVFIILFFIDKKERIKLLKINTVLIISIVIGFFILSFFLKENTRNLNNAYTATIILIIKNPFLIFKSFSIGMFSGIVSFKYFVTIHGMQKSSYTFFSLLFMISYVFVFFIYLKKKLYKKSILPPVLMVYSIVFIFSVLVYRYNPLENGINCFIIPRYLQYYQVGIIGYLWGVFLILSSIKQKGRKNIINLAFSTITLLLVFLWVINFSMQVKTSNYLIDKYPLVSSDIRDKLIYKHKKIPWVIQPADKDITQQLLFLKEHKLNVFSPCYPYLDTINDFNKNE